MSPSGLPTPIKGKADWRTYKAFQLDNGVTGLAIHDKESKTTGMSCVVNVGAAADPRSLSGLAHFCEHMCFLGSEKYPGENEYKRYLASHGGRSNASTSMHLTNYKFDVLADHAEKAVDIFSNFFISPMFTVSGTSREVQAVDSENSKNLTADSRRRLQILKDLADPEHYYSKFSTGNATTLPTHDQAKVEEIRAALLAFHRKHYHPKNMTVVIAGPQSLETLQEWVVSGFADIQPKPFPAVENATTEVERLIDEAASEAPPNSLDQPPPPFKPAFLPAIQGGSWPVLLTTKPLRSMRKLALMWPMPSDDKRVPDQSSMSILSHLLGHEGAGSAFAVLQNHGMLSSLSAGPRTKAPDFTLFQVDMGLTEKGERHWEQVVDLIFSYCRLLQDEADKSTKGESQELSRIWDEMSRLDQLFFHQTSPGAAYAYAPNLAERVVAYGTEKCLSAGSMLKEDESTFPLEKVANVVKLLDPSNCIVERCSEEAWFDAIEAKPETVKDGFGKRLEPWYGVEYILAKMDSATISSWEGKTPLRNAMSASELSLPRPNRYIPRSLELCPDLAEEAKQGPRIEKPIDPPNLVVRDCFGRLFHRLDDRYALPQSSLNLLIRNAAIQNRKSVDGNWEYCPNSSLLSSMVSGAFSEAMAQETYDADLAGLYWSLHLGPSGIKLSCFGFSDRLPDLALKILQEFLSGDFLQAAYFESTKDRVIRGLRTYFASRRADSHALYYRDALLASKDNGIDESLALAEAATLRSVKAHYEAVLANNEISLDCLFSGNVSESDAKEFYSQASAHIKDAQDVEGSMSVDQQNLFIPAGSVERRVRPGEDIELHFTSKNPEEENGAVVMTYQSSIPAFKGDGISHALGLKSTAAIRLLCHMLREPLFDDLRTKQQLGYIVSSYYELGYSSRQNDESIALGPLTTPVDFMTIAILSRKLPPQEVASRIDDFVNGFRETLVTMPESELSDHADALSVKLLKPIPKLQTEATNHFGRIQRYGPELFHGESSNAEERLPWESVKTLAGRIRSVDRMELLETWDRMTCPSSRCRIVTCVYGNTFPLTDNVATSGSTTVPGPSTGWLAPPRTKIFNGFSDLLQLRRKLDIFDNSPTQKRRFSIGSPLNRWVVGCVLGVGVVGMSMLLRSQKQAKRK